MDDDDRRLSPEEECLEAAPWPERTRATARLTAPLASASSRETPEPDEEDDDISLPPLDDDERDLGNEADDDDDELLPALDDDSADPFDDAAASDLETGIDLGMDDDADRGGEDTADEGLDVGPLDEGMHIQDEAESAADDLAEEGALEDDDDFGAAEEMRGEDDGGDEGMESADEDLDEASLPALDADEDGNYESEDMLAELSLPDASLPPWDALRWVAVDGAGAAVPCSALAVGSGRVIAGGEVVLIVDEGAHAARRSGFEAGASSVAIADEGAFVAAIRGQLWISRDDGKSASLLVGWRGGRGSIELVTTPGRLWILSGGALWMLAATTGPAVQVRSGGVARVAASGGTLTALTRAPSGPLLERLRGDDEGWQATKLEGSAQIIAGDESALLAAAGGGRLIAIADKETLCVSRDGGVSFETFNLPGVATLVFAGDNDRAPLLALLARDTEDTGYVVYVPADGPATTVAELAPGGSSVAAEDDDAPLGAAAMGWDGSREVVWLACRAGLFALARARKH